MNNYSRVKAKVDSHWPNGTPLRSRVQARLQSNNVRRTQVLQHNRSVSVDRESNWISYRTIRANREQTAKKDYKKAMETYLNQLQVAKNELINMSNQPNEIQELWCNSVANYVVNKSNEFLEKISQ